MQLYPPFPTCRQDTPKRQAEKQIYEALAASDLDGHALYEVRPIPSITSIEYAIK